MDDSPHSRWLTRRGGQAEAVCHEEFPDTPASCGHVSQRGIGPSERSRVGRSSSSITGPGVSEAPRQGGCSEQGPEVFHLRTEAARQRRDLHCGGQGVPFVHCNWSLRGVLPEPEGDGWCSRRRYSGNIIRHSVSRQCRGEERPRLESPTSGPHHQVAGVGRCWKNDGNRAACYSGWRR